MSITFKKLENEIFNIFFAVGTVMTLSSVISRNHAYQADETH